MKKHLSLMLMFSLITFIAGAQWVEQATGFTTASRGIRNISIVDANTVWVSAYDGSGDAANNVQEFSRTVDAGTTWTPGVINVGNAGMGIAMLHAATADKAWVVAYPNGGGQQGGIFITTDAGANWARQTTASFSSASSFANVVYFWDELNGFCQGDPVNNEFELYTTTDGGTTWEAVDVNNIPAPLTGEYGYVGQYAASGDHIWFSTNKGRLYHSTDKGYTWTVAQTPLSDFGSETMSGNFDFTSGTNGLIVDKNNTLFQTTDGGDTWTDITNTGHYATDIAAVPGMPGTYVNTGNSDGTSYTNYNGDLWEQLIHPTDKQLLETSWFNASTGWAGSFNTDATTGGIFKFDGTIPSLLSNDVAVTNIINPTDGAALTATENVTIAVTNYGLDSQTGFNVSYSFDGAATVTETFTATINVGETVEFTFTSATVDLTTIGSHNIVASTDLSGDENPSNDEFNSDFNLLSFVPTKVVVYEEGTGTWCGWCVRGIVGLNHMAENHADGTWIGIAVHNGDPMTDTDYDAALTPLHPEGFPGGVMDRHDGSVDPGLDVLEEAYQDHAAIVPVAKIEVTDQSYDGFTRDFSIEIASTFAMDYANGDYNTALIMVENDVTGEEAEYGQVNEYAGGNFGSMVDVNGYNWGSVVAQSPRPASQMHYYHVARQLVDGWAGTNTIPAAITHDVANTYTYSGNVSADYDDNEISFVAIIIDNTTGKIVNAVEVELDNHVGVSEINNSNFSIYPNPTTGIVKIEGAEGSQVIVYNMLGSEVYNNVNASEMELVNLSSFNAGNYIVKVINNNEVSTQKIILTK